MILKNALFALVTIGLMVGCVNQNSTNDNDNRAQATDESAVSMTKTTGSEQLGIIEFEEAAFDFGNVKEGAVVEHVFKFKNTGNAPVILSQVSASCGCTTPDFTKEPVLPGKVGEIKVSFNSLGQVGTQQKIVTVSSNAENRVTTVQIKGVVEK